MQGKERHGQFATRLPPRCVIVVAAEGGPDALLKRLLPELSAGGYDVRSSGRIALAVQPTPGSITVRSSPQRDVILLGSVVSEAVGPGEALDWAISTVAAERWEQLKALQGVFVLAVVNWAAGAVTVVSDLLGIKPFYVSQRQGATILSDRAEVPMRLGGGRIDSLGLGGWLYFGTPLVERTLFDGVQRIPAALVMMLDGHSTRQSRYWTPPVAEEPIGVEALMDGVYGDFAASVERLLAPYDRATVLLSGGFDSRLSLLTILRQGRVKLEAVTVPYNRAERQLAGQLAEMTGVPCRRIEPNGSVWDAFDSMWYIHPDGFPITKNLTYLCVAAPGASGPFIDGSISSVAIRCLTADPPDGPPADQEAARSFVWKAHAHWNPHMFFKPVFGEKVMTLGRRAADELSDAIGWHSKFCLRWDTCQDERRYTPINFLQYEHLAPSVQPFYDRALIERRLSHPNRLFTKDSYHGMLRRRFDGPGGLPHSSDLPKGRDSTYIFSRALWRQLPAAMRFTWRRRDVLNTRWLLPRLAAYGAGRSGQMYLLKGLLRLVMLERELNRCGMELDFHNLLA
jgi:hypothetical protein